MRKRADLLLVERGFFDSRAKAQAAIAAGLVSADGVRVEKPSASLAFDVPILAEPAYPYVSRGGVKLAFALDAFGLSVEGCTALDVGASTGGFCDVLLKRGAARVYAVDTGHGQLHPSIASDQRIVSFEGTDARALTRGKIVDPVNLITIDVSFISLTLVLEAALSLAALHAWLVALIKPQFEAGRDHVKRGGIVRDDAVQRDVCERIAAHVETLRWTVKGILPSPITGGDGNQEFLLAAERGT